jgi:Rieske 2Fe-2S family protein
MAGQGDGAPLPAEGLAGALGPFGESRLLPRAAYVDQAVFEWEQRHFFRGGWMCVGRSEVVAHVGDQRAESVGGAGVFLVRGEDRQLRAFANTCRHRGHELLPCGESRNLHVVVCPYHSWSYRLDGSLRNAPRFDGWSTFAPEENGLVELPVEEFHGLVFVAASGHASPLREHLAGLNGLVAPYEPERLRVGADHDFVMEANWKVVIENYQECYDCPMIHPELCAVSPPRSGENYPVPDADINAYVMTHLLTPLGPGRTRVRCSWSFSPEDLEGPEFDPSYASDFWDITNRQDFSACESVQRGLASEHWVPGQLGPDEDGVYQFVTMVARAYRGTSVTAGSLPGAQGSDTFTTEFRRGRN